MFYMQELHHALLLAVEELQISWCPPIYGGTIIQHPFICKEITSCHLIYGGTFVPLPPNIYK